MKLRFLIPVMFLAACCGSAIAQPSDAQVRSWAAGCSNCHGTQGRALEGMDAIAGDDRAKTLKKLMDYKNGRTVPTVMHQIAKGYSDEQLAAIAGWFAAQKP
jgi:cytochrome subunit of sulfide dehydrogenase